MSSNNSDKKPTNAWAKKLTFQPSSSSSSTTTTTTTTTSTSTTPSHPPSHPSTHQQAKKASELSFGSADAGMAPKKNWAAVTQQKTAAKVQFGTFDHTTTPATATAAAAAPDTTTITTPKNNTTTTNSNTHTTTTSAPRPVNARLQQQQFAIERVRSAPPQLPESSASSTVTTPTSTPQSPPSTSTDDNTANQQQQQQQQQQSKASIDLTASSFNPAAASFQQFSSAAGVPVMYPMPYPGMPFFYPGAPHPQYAPIPYPYPPHSQHVHQRGREGSRTSIVSAASSTSVTSNAPATTTTTTTTTTTAHQNNSRRESAAMSTAESTTAKHDKTPNISPSRSASVTSTTSTTAPKGAWIPPTSTPSTTAATMTTPAPSATGSTSSSLKADAPLFVPPSQKPRKKLLIVNPDTNEAIDVKSIAAATTTTTTTASATGSTLHLQADTTTKLNVHKKEDASKKGDETENKVELKPVPTTTTNAATPEVASVVEKKPVVPVPVKKDEKPVEKKPAPSKTAVVTEEKENKLTKPAPTTPASPAKKTEADQAAPLIQASPGQHNTHANRRVYTIEFLLRFKELCRERPDQLPAMEAIVGEESGAGGSRRMSKKDRSSGSDMMMSRDRSGPAGGRFSDMGLSSGGGRGPRGSRGGGPKPPPGLGGGKGRRQSAMARSHSARGSQYHQEFEPLKRSENAWTPSLGKKDAATEEADARLLKEARSLLNKLTVEKFDTITAKILQLDISSAEQVGDVVGLIFDKAVDEPKFGGMYANLCLRLSQSLSPFSQEYIEFMRQQAPGNTNDQNYEKRFLFRRMMLRKCQVEFESKNDWADAVELKISDDMSEEELAAVAAEETKRRKLKRRTLGNIRFIGELYKLAMLPEKIMHECVKHLLRNIETPEEEDIESLADLMVTIGEKVDRPDQAALMAAFFDRIIGLSTHSGLPSRIRFKLKDVIELRSRRWQQRERSHMLYAGPMKIGDVHQMAQEVQQKHDLGIKSRDSSRRGRPPVHPSMGRGSAAKETRDGWSSRKGASGSTKSGRRGDVGSGAAASKEASPGDVTIMSRTSSSDSVKDPNAKSASMSSSSSNMFEALMASGGDHDEEPVSSDIELEGGDDSGAATGATKPDEMEAAELDMYFKKQFIKEFGEAAISSAGAEDGIFEEAALVVDKLKGFVPRGAEKEVVLRALQQLMTDIAPEAFKMHKEVTARHKVYAAGYVFAQYFVEDGNDAGLVPGDDLKQVLEDQLVNLPDMAIDIPGLDKSMGVVLAYSIAQSASMVDLAFIQACLQKYADEMGDFTPTYRKGRRDPPCPEYATLFATLLETLDRTNNEDLVKELLVEVATASGVGIDKLGVDYDQLRVPWWGTEKRKTDLVPDAALDTWLGDVGLKAKYLPKLANTSALVQGLAKEVSMSNGGEFKRLAADELKALLSSTKTVEFLPSLVGIFIRHAHRLADLFGKNACPEKDQLNRLLVDSGVSAKAAKSKEVKAEMKAQILKVVKRQCQGGEYEDMVVGVLKASQLLD